MLISYLFLFLAFNVIDLGEAQNVCADESPCGDHGPAIRFPFRLSSQPEQCGYPGFDLSCTDTNDTVLELPISVKLFVKEIDYISQVIQLYHPHHCFARQLRGLNLSSSSFKFEVEGDYLERYTLFNCSRSAMMYEDLISCLSGPTYQVYALNYYNDIADLPISCTKMYNLGPIPDGISLDGHDKIVRLKWSRPECGHCEVKGKKCRLKNNRSHRTECFPEDKGIVFCPPLYSILSQFSSQHALIATQQRRI
jgi:hypothetical protein